MKSGASEWVLVLGESSAGGFGWFDAMVAVHKCALP